MGVISDIVTSFFSARFYGDVAENREGIGMKFVWLLTIFMTLLYIGLILFYSEKLNSFVSQAPSFANELPSIAIKDGKFSMDHPSPYNIPLGQEANHSWISIDTNYKPLDFKKLREFMESNHVLALITADDIITVKKASTELDIRSFSSFKKDVSVNHDDWMKLSNIIVTKGFEYLVTGTSLILLFGFLLFNLMATFCAALVMKFLLFITRTKLDFSAAMRLAAAARMPICAILAAPLLLGGPFLTGLVAWLIWLGYLVFATLGAKQGAKN